MRFANCLSDALHELKITHKALAQELGVTLHAVNSWTRGVDPSVPGGDNLDKLCTLLEKRREGLGAQIAHLVGHEWRPAVGTDVAEAAAAAERATEEQEADARARNKHRLSNLPLSLSSYVGKGQEVARVSELVQKHRLVTLAGMGGIGKTRLSLEVGRTLLAEGVFGAGVWLIELAPLRDGAYLTQTILQALGVPDRAGVSPRSALQEHLQQRNLLLVLDNCEHLVEACAEMAFDLLSTCAGVTILASSREGLGIHGEFLWQVPTLTMPAPLPAREQRKPGELAGYEATDLFLERARSVLPGFVLDASNVAAVEEICRRLDGVPLAIELATALLAYLSPEQIARGLNKRFNLLTSEGRDVLPRHKTLHAAVEWSYSLLTEAEKALFRRMSVFAGDCGLDAVEAVCAGEEVESGETLLLLRRLVDKSLVQVKVRRNEGRYVMLETVRAYAREQLERHGEAGTLDARHASYYLGLAEDVGPRIRLAAGANYIEHIDSEKDNLLLAFDWSMRHSTLLGLRLIAALGWYWQLNILHTEGVVWLKKILPVARESIDSASDEQMKILADALLIGAKLGRWCGEADFAWACIRECVDLLKSNEEHLGMVDAMIVYAPLACINGKISREEELVVLEDTLAMARKLGDKWGECQLLTGLAWRALWRGEYATGESYFNANLTLAREIDHRQSVAGALINLGDMARLKGDWTRARSMYVQSLALARHDNIRWASALALAGLGRVLLEDGDTKSARQLLAESIEVIGQRQTLHDKTWTLVLIVWALLEDGELDKACKLMGGVSVLREMIGVDAVITRTADIERVSDQVRELLSDIRNELLWEEGRNLDMVQMLEYAEDAAAGRL